MSAEFSGSGHIPTELEAAHAAAAIGGKLLGDALEKIAHVEAERDRYADALRECTRLSGADLSDGFPTWPALPDFAVQEVKQLRDDYDEAINA